jgi:hypothetical protein
MLIELKQVIGNPIIWFLTSSSLNPWKFVKSETCNKTQICRTSVQSNFWNISKELNHVREGINSFMTISLFFVYIQCFVYNEVKLLCLKSSPTTRHFIALTYPLSKTID